MTLGNTKEYLGIVTKAEKQKRRNSRKNGLKKYAGTWVPMRWHKA
jgi:hypothetical protein